MSPVRSRPVDPDRNSVSDGASGTALYATGRPASNGVNGKVAVVLLTYNGKLYLPDLFASIAKTAYAREWDVIVVDNASTDGTTEWLLNYESGIRNNGSPHNSLFIIHNSCNVGFAEGNNVGIRKAIADGAEYVVLLNQDTVVEPDWLMGLVCAAESDPTIGAVQARLMLWDKKDVVNSLGNEIHFLGFGYTSGYKKTYNLQLTTYNSSEITYASGAAVLYRARALQDVGLFDASLWMYHEDLDLGWRLWRAGWKSVLAPASVVYHKYEFSRSIKKYYYMERNRFLVLLENYSFRALALIAPALVAMEIGLCVKAFASGWGQEKLRAYAFFLRPATWRLVLTKRKEKQKLFRYPEREVLSHFTGKIEFQDVRNSIIEYIANPIFNLYWQITQNILKLEQYGIDARRQIIRFLIVGISSTIIDMSLLIALKERANFRPIFAVATNQIFVLFYNFIMNKYWSFATEKNPFKQFSRYSILVIFNYFFSIVFMYVLYDIIGIHYTIARLYTIAFFVVVNFIFYKHWVYKET